MSLPLINDSSTCSDSSLMTVSEKPQDAFFLSEKMTQAIANPLFPALDSALRSGRHIGMEEMDNHSFIMDFQDQLEQFYQRYHVELVRAPEGFFYLRPRSNTLIARSVLSELDMLVGKVLCYLYLSPERLAHEGIFSCQELYEELITLTDEIKLLKLLNPRSNGSDVDKQKLYERVKTSLNRLRRLGMIQFICADLTQFRIREAIFRFGADVRSANLQEAQLQLIRDGEGISMAEDSLADQNDKDVEE